jgi:predicted small metal-binding protein
MRVVECNECGEALSGANDDELRAVVIRHMESEHADAEFDEDGAAKFVQEEAYSASDS